MSKLLRITLVALNFMLLSFVNNIFCSDEISKEEWNPVSAGPVTTWTAPLCGKGKFVLQPFFFYNRTRGSFDSEGHYSSLPEGGKKYQYQEQLFMQYGITDKLEIDAQAVYQENYIRQNDAKAQASGFGDSYLFLRYCAFEEKGRLPHLSALAQLKIPSGKYQHADQDKLGTDLMGATSGGGSWDPGFGLNLTKKVKPFLFHADAVYSVPRKVMVDGVKTIYGKYINYDFGAEYFLPGNFNLILEANGFLQSDIKYLTIASGIGWSCDNAQMLLAYQRTVEGTNTDANDSLVLTAVYQF